mmetsp:Transcript_65042/g.155446  ORF Transcript_65042/g.155446 Transcript_65042/m.155446 type:complete len:492 (-) Transcript_65042:2412-3887(-)
MLVERLAEANRLPVLHLALPAHHVPHTLAPQLLPQNDRVARVEEHELHGLPCRDPRGKTAVQDCLWQVRPPPGRDAARLQGHLPVLRVPRHVHDDHVLLRERRARHPKVVRSGVRLRLHVEGAVRESEYAPDRLRLRFHLQVGAAPRRKQRDTTLRRVGCSLGALLEVRTFRQSSLRVLAEHLHPFWDARQHREGLQRARLEALGRQVGAGAHLLEGREHVRAVGEPILGLLLQRHFDEVDHGASGRDLGLHRRRRSCPDFVLQRLVVVPGEWTVPLQHFKIHDARGPHVHAELSFRTGRLLWGGIRRRAQNVPRFRDCFRRELLGGPEIDNDNPVAAVTRVTWSTKHDVVGLDVAVNHRLLVQHAHPSEKSPHDPHRLLLIQTRPLLLQPLIETLSVDELHHQRGAGVDKLQKLDHVGVHPRLVQKLEVADLPPDTRDVLQADLDRNCPPRRLLSRQPDSPMPTLPKKLLEHVPPHSGGSLSELGRCWCS